MAKGKGKAGLHFLTDAELVILRDMARRHRSGGVNTPSRPDGDRAWSEGQDWLAPEVYVASPHDGVIPGSSGTTPGKAICDIYCIQNDVAGDGEPILVKVPSTEKWTYNVSPNEIAQDFVITTRDKFGRWLVTASVGGSQKFKAILINKKSKQIDLTFAAASSDDPFTNCQEGQGPFWYGEYTWVEAVESDDRAEWTPKRGGRFGVAGERDAAIEINRANVNVHVKQMVVEMTQGNLQSDKELESSEQSSSSVHARHLTVRVGSTDYHYWFDLGLPREDCANRYLIPLVQGNDA